MFVTEKQVTKFRSFDRCESQVFDMYMGKFIKLLGYFVALTKFWLEGINGTNMIFQTMIFLLHYCDPYEQQVHLLSRFFRSLKSEN